MFLSASPARASCVNPTGNAGDFRYYGGFQTLEYCDGASWVAMGPVGDARTGLVGWWKLDETSGTSTSDSSGNGYTGTLYNAPTWSSGMNNGALTFTAASSQYVSTGNITTPSNVSIAFWAKTTAPAPDTTLFDWGGYCICAMASNGTGKMLCTADFSGNGVISTSPIDDGNWHYFVFTNQPSPLVAQLYVDGVLNSTNTTDTLGGDIGIPQTVYFGQKGDGSQYFSGTIDDVRVYNRVLTAQDVHTLYTSTGPLSGDIQTGLIHYWNLDEASGKTTAADSAGGATATKAGTADFTASGKIKNGLSLPNSASSYFSLADPANILGVSTLTISMWFKRTVATSYIELGQYDNAHGNWLGIWTHPADGVVSCDLGNTIGSYAGGTTPSSFADTSWHLAVCVFDGTQAGNANRLKGYVDGVQQTLTFTGTIPATTSSTSTTFYLGSDDTTDANNGTIDDVRVYSRALSASDVLTLYNTYATSCASPVGYAGDMLYNADNHVPQFCNDTNWIPLGPVPGSGGAGCTGGSERDLIYNKDKGYLQYCDGTNWIAIGQSYYGPQTGLVGWWKLDETSGTSASDSSGNGNTGTANNTTIVAGQINNARQFNGTTDYVHVNDSSSLHLGSLTLSAWVYATAIQGANAGGEEELLDKRSGSCGAYDLRMAGTSFPLLLNLTLDGGTGTELSTNGGSVPQNTWTHVTATFDNSSKQVNLYVNGVLQHTTTMAIDPSVNPCTTVLSLGDAGAIVGDPSIYETVGKLDDVRVYNRALSASEVWQLYLVTGGQ